MKTIQPDRARRRISRVEPGEESIAAFEGDHLPHVRRPWSDFLAQFEGILRQRGSAALPFAAGGDFRVALRDLISTVDAMEHIGVRFRPAGHFGLGPDLVGALVALRGEIGRAYDSAKDDRAADVIMLAKWAQKHLKNVLAAVKTAWPYEDEGVER